MIGILIDTGFLSLKPESEVTLRFNSNFMEDQGRSLSYSLPIDLPVADNAPKLEHLQIIENTVLSYKNTSGILFVENAPYRKVTLEITAWNAEYYRGVLYLANALHVDYFDKKISEILPDDLIDIGYEGIFLNSLVNATWTDKFCLPTVMAAKFGDGIGTWTGEGLGILINYYNTELFLGSPKGYELQIISPTLDKILVPMFFLRHIFSVFPFLVGGTLFENAWFDKLIIFNNYSLTEEQAVTIDVGLPEYYTLFGQASADGLHNYNTAAFVNTKNHLPDMQVKDFLRELCSMFCCYLGEDEVLSELKINTKKSLIESEEVVDYTPNWVQGYEGQFVNNALRSIAYKSKVYEPFEPDGAEGKIEIEADTLPHVLITADDILSLLLARFSLVWQGVGTGDKSVGFTGEKLEKLTLLFFNGMISDVPSASSFTDTINLAINRDMNSLYEQLFAPYLNFLRNTKKVNVQLKLSFAELLNFDLYKKIRLENVVYIINSAEVTISDRGLYLMDLELYTVASFVEELCSTTVTVIYENYQ